MRANERTDERVAQYFSLYSWLFSTIVSRAICLCMNFDANDRINAEKRTKEGGERGVEKWERGRIRGQEEQVPRGTADATTSS